MKHVGLDVCPYCGGTDIRPGNELHKYGELGVFARAFDCENCGQTWLAEYRPAAYFTYDWDNSRWLAAGPITTTEG